MPWSLVIEYPLRLWLRGWSVAAEAEANRRSLMAALDEIRELRKEAKSVTVDRDAAS